MNSKTSNIIATSLVILCVIAITWCLYILKPVLIPFVFAIFIYFLMEPFIEYFQSKLRFPKLLAVGTTFIFLVLILTFFSFVVSISVRALLTSGDVYRDQLLLTVDQISMLAKTFDIQLDVSVVKQYLGELPLLKWLQTVSGSLVTVIGNLVLIVIFLLFFLLGKNPNYVKSEFLDTDVRRQITRYIGTKVIVSALTAVLVGAVFTIMNVQLALMFATLAFFLNFIPNIGSLISTLIPAPILFLQFGFGWMMVLGLLLPGLIQFLVGNLIDPKLMGKNLGLHPVAILLSLLLWGFIWGVPGMFLAVPMTAILKLFLELGPNTIKLARILEGDVSFSAQTPGS